MRLYGYDYRLSAYYFVTICTYQRNWYFENESFKQIVEIVLQKIMTKSWPEFAHVEIDAFVIMPNHIHFVFAFVDQTQAKENFEIESKRLAKSLGSLMATFKSEVTKMARRITRDFELNVWQRGYYDRIIRDETEHNRIREYIRSNPERWEADSEYTEQRLDQMLERMTRRTK